MERAEQSKRSTSKVPSQILLGGVGTEQQESSSSVKVVMQIYRSQQNGMVYDPDGIAPCLCVGCHSGVEPKIIVYE